VLTVIARTPGAGVGKKREISAFLVTPDLPGFEVVEKRMEKISIRGTATARLAFHDMFVPKENLLGELGKGLRIGLTVLDFGRVAFGATCTGAAKTMLRLATAHARKRVQFEQPIAEFELVQKKIAQMAAAAFAMEAMTTQCAALIDRGGHDYMLETAILKVWSTDELWRIVFDTMQIYGGKGFFTDEPLGRWMRDARLNTIGEGSNDVLRPFIAMVGIKPVADLFLRVKDAMAHPLRQPGKLLRFVGEQLHSRLTKPQVPTHHSRLKREARDLGARVRDFGLAIQSALIRHREQILFRQLVQERLANAACELYASACVLSRLDHLLSEANGHAGQIERDLIVGKHFLHESNRRIRQNLAAVRDNEDPSLLRAARAVLEG
jgi:alkylation response protein AidB-like acyl-CoA dehydrogenase